ncbi:unnamed protein product [Echinostoma caproni]|uniref:DUF4953 domain-containing protein n=1 Tax=Echinostoma caproni TaxID=27848 RepID=A0A183AB27_9TREM|nr:unnamed protein product [Echinostoma caproni]
MLTTAIKDPDSYGAVGNESDPPFSYAHCVRMLSRYEEFLLRKALSREPDVRWCPSGCGLSDLEYADEIVLSSEDPGKLQGFLDRLSAGVAMFSMRFAPPSQGATCYYQTVLVQYPT